MIKKEEIPALFKSLGAENIPTEEETNAKALKELKKLFDSYMQVAQHMFGRVPTPEEMIGMLSHANPNGQVIPQKEQVQPQPQEPMQESAPEIRFTHKQEPMSKAAVDSIPQKMNIMNAQVYYGRDENKNPDPKSILYYEHPNGVYSVDGNKWLDGRPNVLDHLDSRPLMYNAYDLNHYILHGLMDDDEHAQLAHMLPADCQKIWDLKKRIESDQAMMNDEAEGSADTHSKMHEMEFDIRELLNAIDNLKFKQEAMLKVLMENGLGAQFAPQEEAVAPSENESPSTVVPVPNHEEPKLNEVVGQPGVVSL